MSPYQQKKFREYFDALNVGDYIYPGHIKSKLNSDINSVYHMLEELKDLGFLINVYEVYCFECSRSKGIFIEAIADFNKNWYCDNCNSNLNPTDNLIVLYKVVTL